jgi:hypothetical protein
VRFQALRQFTTLGDDWPLDFVPLAPNADGGMNVLAAAIAPELVEHIRKACTGAGVHVSRLVLRPFAAAALLQDQLGDGKCRMIVDLVQDEADLTVLIGPQVIFPRTVRLPAVSEAEILARVLGEGRRTIIAAQNAWRPACRRGRHLWRRPAPRRPEATARKSYRCRSRWLILRPVRGRLAARKPDFPGTFAPLLGMLLDEAAATGHGTPFSTSQEATAPQSAAHVDRGQRGIAAVVLLGLGGVWWHQEPRRPDSHAVQAHGPGKLAGRPLREDGRFRPLCPPDDRSMNCGSFRKVSASGRALVEELTASFEPKGGSCRRRRRSEGRIREIEESPRRVASDRRDRHVFDPEAAGS